MWGDGVVGVTLNLQQTRELEGPPSTTEQFPIHNSPGIPFTAPLGIPFTAHDVGCPISPSQKPTELQGYLAHKK